jgi:mono/diheme cytochrome c family protein
LQLLLRICLIGFALCAAETPREVSRILEQHCYRCHGEEAKAGLRLDRPDAWEEDVPQRIWTMVSGKGREIMPPEGKLSKGELSTLKKWAAKGAKR